MTPGIADIQGRLEAYFGTPLIYFRVLASGWETMVFEFSLPMRSSRASELPAGQDLVLRFYQGSRAGDKANREAAVMPILADLNYPVPRSYLFETDPEPLGAPFLIMERVPGRPLFSTGSFPQAFKTFSMGFIAFVRAQVRLHSLAANAPNALMKVPHAFESGNAASTKPLLERVFRIIEERIERGPLPGLSEGLSRLRQRAARYSPAPESFVHMDYHPQNVMVRGVRVTGVLDWVNADRGDRHLCAATTAVILSTTAMEHPRWMRENAAGNSLRAIFRSLYLPLYNAAAPMELERFRYSQGVAALLRLSMFGMMQVRGPESVGFRPEAIENVTPSVVRLLTRYAAKKVGVNVSI